MRDDMLFPIKPKDFYRVRFTSKYGYRTHPVTGARGTFHRGIDLSSMGRNGVIDIIASGDGIIHRNRPNPTGYGNYLIIKHKDNKHTLYAHKYQLSNFREGSTVKAGQVIGKIGTTGVSTGPHLHFEIHEGGHTFPSQVVVGSSRDTTVDPLNYFPTLAPFLGKANLNSFDPQTTGHTKVMWVGKVVSDTLRIRMRPTTDAPIVKVLNKGDYVTVYDEVGSKPYTWLEIGDDEYVSNARGEYVKSVKVKLFDAKVAVSTLNVRNLPSTDHDVKRKLTHGTVVPVYGEFGDWLYIGKGEFIHGDYVWNMDDKEEVKEDDRVDKVVLVHSTDDIPTAKRLASVLKCAITFDARYVKAKELYVVGGQPPSNYDGKVIPLGGKTYFKTVANVEEYLENR